MYCNITYSYFSNILIIIIKNTPIIQKATVSNLRTCLWKNAPKRVRTVSRVYGGTLSAEAVKHRIMRAFFNEELKCIKQGALKARKGKKRTQKKH